MLTFLKRYKKFETCSRKNKQLCINDVLHSCISDSLLRHSNRLRCQLNSELRLLSVKSFAFSFSANNFLIFTFYFLASQQIKTIERYMRRLEFHMSKVKFTYFFFIYVCVLSLPVLYIRKVEVSTTSENTVFFL